MYLVSANADQLPSYARDQVQVQAVNINQHKMLHELNVAEDVAAAGAGQNSLPSSVTLT
jgi:hypothetical protein